MTSAAPSHLLASAPTNTSSTRSTQEPPLSRRRVDGTDVRLNRLKEMTKESNLVDRAMEIPSMLGRNEMYVRQLKEEYLKFLLLKATSKDTNAKHLSPSGEVDLIWHLHLLDTRNYAACCDYLDVGFIHHNPHGVNDGSAQEERLSNTRRLYHHVFGYRPQGEFWGDDENLFRGSSCQHVVLEDGHKRLLFECGHVDCKCEPSPFCFRFHYNLSDEDFNSLYWSNMETTDTDRAQAASEALTAKIVEWIEQVHDGDGAMSQFFQQMIKNRDRDTGKPFFLRDRLPNTWHTTSYLLKECPNHVVSGLGRFQVLVKTLTGKVITISVLPTYSVIHLKLLVQKSEGIPIGQQRLIFEGRELEDPRALADYNVQDAHIIHLVLRLCGC